MSLKPGSTSFLELFDSILEWTLPSVCIVDAERYSIENSFVL